MAETPPVKKTFAEINAKIRTGKAVVVTAEEMVDVVRTDGVGNAARKMWGGTGTQFLRFALAVV